MQKIIKEEWQSMPGSKLSKKKSEYLLVMVKELNELDWFLHDAYDGTTVFADSAKSHTYVVKPKIEPKKQSFDADELERQQLYQQIKALERQINVVKSTFFVSKISWTLVLAIAFLLVSSDLVDIT
jgi:hypothetical protein